MAYVFSLAFMPGLLSIFYGDEIGVQGIGNLDNRKPMPWDNPDLALLEFFKITDSIPYWESLYLDFLFLHDSVLVGCIVLGFLTISEYLSY